MFKQMKPGLFLTIFLLGALPAPITLAQTAAPGLQANQDLDGRRPIVVRPNERNRILANMRTYLIGVQSMTEALAAEDMPAAAAAARAMGSVNLYDLKLMFPSSASIEFHNLAFEVHRDFDVIANDAQAKQDPRLMLRQLGATLKKCTHCHETYRLDDKAH
jgi:hypothetical protein